MFIARKQQSGFQQAGLRHEERIVDFLHWQQATLAQLLGNTEHNPMGNGHQIHRHDIPTPSSPHAAQGSIPLQNTIGITGDMKEFLLRSGRDY